MCNKLKTILTISILACFVTVCSIEGNSIENCIDKGYSKSKCLKVNGIN